MGLEHLKLHEEGWRGVPREKETMRAGDPSNPGEERPLSAVLPGPSARCEIHDVIGVGSGPANLALAVCLEEEAEEGRRDLSRLFLEIKPRAVWHPGMLLEDSLIQISVLKDLATIRNPRSRFTFLNDLKSRGRLFEFLNLRDLFPTRIEFNDYLGLLQRYPEADVTRWWTSP
jgi:hypothetical protein